MSKQKETNEDVIFPNIVLANDKFKQGKEQEQKTQMNIRVSKQAYYTFDKLQSRFTADTGLFDAMRESKEFWRLAIEELKCYLIKQGKYSIAPKNFSNMVKRIGRRPKGGRYHLKEDIVVTSFGTYNDDTLSIYDNIMFSLAKQENMEHLREYSRSYFFYDVVDFLEQHIEELILKHKVFQE